MIEVETMPYRAYPTPPKAAHIPDPIPVALGPWRAGSVVCVDGRAWLEITRCELTDRVHVPAVFDPVENVVVPATVDYPNLRVVMTRMRWVTPDVAPEGALRINQTDLFGDFPPLVVAGQAWRLMDRDWVCKTSAANPRTNVVDALTELTLVLVRAWWDDPVVTTVPPVGGTC